MHNSAKFPLAHVVQEKQQGVDWKNVCVCILSVISNLHAVQEKHACEWTEKMSVHAQ